MKNTRYKQFTILLICAWFLFSLSASALGLYKSDVSRPPIVLALAAVLPILLFSLWYSLSAAGLRRFALSLNPRALTMAQTFRINGFVFLVLSAMGILPAIFALPAGLGDMAIGITAPLIADKLAGSRFSKGIVRWQVLGMVDLVMAVSLGATAGLFSSGAATTTPMTVLPLSIIPVFFVPLLFILHLVCIVQARQQQADSSEESLLSSAA